MEIKLFYKTQRELANSLNLIIDSYWDNSINEETLIKSVSDIYNNNSNKFFKHDEFTTILKQQCGKRRLEIIERVLHMSGVLVNGKIVG